MPDLDPQDLAALEARFSALAAAAVPPLPGSAAARARGRQRTRRGRAVLAGAGASLAVLALAAAVALGGGGGDRDRITTAPPARAGAPVAADLSAALLEAPAVEKVRSEPGQWQARATDDLPFTPMPAGCRGEQEVFGSPSQTALRFLDGPEPLVAGHALKAYGDEEAAVAAFGRLIDSITCDSGQSDITRYRGPAGSGPSRFYGGYRQSAFAVVFAVERVGAVLTGVAVRSPAGPPGVAVEQLSPLADVAAGGLRAATSATSDVPVPDDGLLRPADLAAVQPGAWEGGPLSDPEGGLSPCQSASADGRRPSDPSSAVWARLQLARDEAATIVQQSVALYPDAEQAAEALSVQRAGIRGCRTEEVRDGASDTPEKVLSVATHRVVEQSPDLVLVRSTYACATCGGRASYLAVTRVEARVTVLNVFGTDPDEDLADLAEAVVAAARSRLAEVS